MPIAARLKNSGQLLLPSDSEVNEVDSVVSLNLTSSYIYTEIKERLNLVDLPLYTDNRLPQTGVLGGFYDTYSQANCYAAAVDASCAIGERYGVLIYRPPNKTVAVDGDTMWGGLNLWPPEQAKVIGHTYRLSFWVKGQTSSVVSFTLPSFSVGWPTYGIGLPSASSAITAPASIGPDFYSEYWTYREWVYTIAASRWSQGLWYCDTTINSNIVNLGTLTTSVSGSIIFMNVGDTISGNPNIPAGATVTVRNSATQFIISVNATATAANVSTRTQTLFDCARNMKIGFVYDSTGVLGSKLFISGIVIEDVTGKTVTEAKAKVGSLEVGEVMEGMNKLEITAAAQITGNGDMSLTQYLVLKINGIAVTMVGSTVGFHLVQWDSSGTITVPDTVYDASSSQYAFYVALGAIPATYYWAVLSYNSIAATDVLLRSQLKSMGMTKLYDRDFSTPDKWKTPYCAFGKGQTCYKEDLRVGGDERWYATLFLYY